ncbi:hypothetical protein JR316_0003488 [Psilocybe cubensis]|uniref:Uncharacterized protein n=1 Tax=Psilocybe cubensis TaxID=181762 RepID=A0ACB8H9Z1_PSICU|nr:hypothetical protein JR316_0003488 [Psilocybe cubensis]KAH9484009.1 hypothetical protein JR316_0003488 [Psilocybe cubensis]
MLSTYEISTLASFSADTGQRTRHRKSFEACLTHTILTQVVRFTISFLLFYTAHLLSRTLTIPTDISGWLPLHLGYFYNCFTSVSRRSGTEKTRALSSMTLSDIFGVLDYLSWSLFTAAFDEERSDSLVRNIAMHNSVDVFSMGESAPWAAIQQHFFSKVSSHPAWLAPSADIFTGLIIASLIVLIFVAVFLLREWMSQNARLGVFEEEELPDLPPVHAPPPQPQLQHQPRLVRHFAPLDPASLNLERGGNAPLSMSVRSRLYVWRQCVRIWTQTSPWTPTDGEQTPK